MAASYGYRPNHSTPVYMPYANGGIPNSGQLIVGPGSPGVQPVFQAPTNGPGFSFRKRFERVDWRKIAAVDIDNISRNLDFQTLQDNITNITFCNIEAELDVRTVDPNFVKLFRLAQLTIEYLLHCQDYLSGMVTGLEEKLRNAIEQHDETKRALDKQNLDLGEIKKESHKRKKMLAAQQQIIHAGANSYNKCPYCSKAFVNATFLQSHLQRRHSENVNGQFAASAPVQITAPPGGQSGLNTAVEGELKEIRERLKLTESQLQEERAALDSLKKKEHAESLRLEEVNRRQLEAWKQEQMQEHKNEIERVKSMFMKELKEMSNKYAASERTLQEMQQRAHQRGSNLGMLQDDVEYERAQLEKQREEVAMLKEQLQQQMGDVESLVKVKFEESEKKWKDKIRDLKNEHIDEREKLVEAYKESQSAFEDERKGRHLADETHDTQIQELIKPPVTPRSTHNPPHSVTSHNPPQRVERSEKQITHDDIQPLQKQTTAAVTRKTAPPMYGDDDDDDDDETEEEEETGVGESTLGTTRDSYTNSGDLTLNTRSLRVFEQLKNNPHILKGLKEELTSMLDTKLEQRGIKMGTTGISTSVLNSQLTMLKTERQKLAKKNENFYDIRAQYTKQIEQMAKDQLKGTTSSGGRKEPSTPSRRVEGNTPQKMAQPLASKASPKPVQTPSKTSSRTSNQTPNQPPPKPAPRSLSPTQQPGARVSQTLSSTGSLGDSSKWESEYEDEESEEDSYLADFPKAAAAAAPPVNKQPAQQSAQAKPSPRQRTPSPRTKPSPRQHTPSPRTHKVPYAQTYEDEESDWDSASELQEVVANRITKNHVSKPSSVPQPNGSLVKDLTRSIEMQLQTRTGNSKPVGGVNTLSTDQSKPATAKGRIADDIDDDDWDEDTFSISSLENNPSKDPVARKSVNRSSHGDTDHSTNTYGTSVWGGSSKAASTMNPGTGTVGTAGKSSISVTDWDSDIEDLNDIPMKSGKPEAASRSRPRAQ